LERGPHGTNGVATSRGIRKEVTGKLEACDTSNGRKPKEHEEIVPQKKKESSRSKGQRTCVAGEQKYPVKLTLKEVGQ